MVMQQDFPLRYGFARIGLSTPNGDWQFGNDGVVNDEYPQPCSDMDSKDNVYLRIVFNFIDENPDQGQCNGRFIQLYMYILLVPMISALRGNISNCMHRVG